MTNDRPPDDSAPDPEGEELVEADLPGAPESWNEEGLAEADLPTTASPEPASPSPDGEPSALEVFDERLRQAEANLEADRAAAAQRRFEETVEAIRREHGPDVDAEALARHDLGLPDPNAAAEVELPPPGEDAPLEMEPFEETRVREAIETEISDESRIRQAEAERAAQAAAEQDRLPRTRADDWDALQPNPPLIQDWGPAERHIDLSERARPINPTTVGAFIVAALAAAGVATAFLLGIGPFGGSDDASGGLPAAATSAATVAPTSVSTEVSAADPLFTDEERTLALMQITAAADLRGDLWLRTELNTGLSGAPDTVAFLYAFALGAAVQTEDGYNGAYYSVTDGVSYAEGVFGSPDFPRTSGQFNAGFQIEQADLWITDDGQLAIHLPGGPSGDGLDASLFGPDTPVIAGVSFLEEQGGTAGGGFEEFTLGEIATGLDWPAPGWTEIEPDQEPLQLNVPDTSNRN